MEYLKALFVAVLAVGFVLIIAFGINVMFTYGVIWIAAELFNVDWTDKFWPVFVAIFLISSILSSGIRKK